MKRLLHLAWLCAVSGAVLLQLGSGHVGAEAPSVERAAVQKAVLSVAPELPLEDAADWEKLAAEDPAFFFRIAAD